MGCFKDLVVMLLVTGISVVSAHTQLTCNETSEICEFALDVRFKKTMTDNDNKLVYLHNGSFYRFDTNASDPAPVSSHGVITADGYAVPRLIITINDEMPGPTITVYEGQKLKVRVTNNLHSDAISIHWHGIHWNTMDGRGSICHTVPDTSGTEFYI